MNLINQEVFKYRDLILGTYPKFQLTNLVINYRV